MFALTGCANIGNSVDFSIEDCTVENNDQYGIYSKNGNTTIKMSMIHKNASDGIYHEGAGHTLTVDRSWILRNGEVGIQSWKSTPTVKNSIVSESSFIKFANAGIRIKDPTSLPVLHNLTISNNKAEGIYFEDSLSIVASAWLA